MTQRPLQGLGVGAVCTTDFTVQFRVSLDKSYSSIYRLKLLTAVGEVRLGFSLLGSYKCLNMIKGLITLKSESEVITRRPRDSVR